MSTKCSCAVCVVSPAYLAATGIRLCINTEIDINTDHFVGANGRYKKWAYNFSFKASHGLDDKRCGWESNTKGGLNKIGCEDMN